MLYLVATPVGNLEDITFRAINVLKSCDYILCEDTRHSLKLLTHYNIQKQLISFHEFNEASREEKAIVDLREGKQIAVISDAGTPLIQDPGFGLIKRCIQEKLSITSIPGPCSVILALTLSGFDPVPFQFVGFVPRKVSEQLTFLENILAYSGTSICFETASRIKQTLSSLVSLAPTCTLALAREVTKKFEEILRGTAKELLEKFILVPPKGELILVISPNQQDIQQKNLSLEEAYDKVMELQKTHHYSQKDAIEYMAKKIGFSKRELYNFVHKKMQDLIE